MERGSSGCGHRDLCFRTVIKVQCLQLQPELSSSLERDVVTETLIRLLDTVLVFNGYLKS